MDEVLSCDDVSEAREVTASPHDPLASTKPPPQNHSFFGDFEEIAQTSLISAPPLIFHEFHLPAHDPKLGRIVGVQSGPEAGQQTIIFASVWTHKGQGHTRIDTFTVQFPATTFDSLQNKTAWPFVTIPEPLNIVHASISKKYLCATNCIVGANGETEYQLLIVKKDSHSVKQIPHPNKSAYVAGYFLNSSHIATDQIIIASDGRAGFIKMVEVEPKRGAVLPLGDPLAQKQIWHEWDPFNQRLVAMLKTGQNNMVGVRVWDLQRGCEGRETAIEVRFDLPKRPYFSGTTIQRPFAAGMSTPDTSVHWRIVPTIYECGTWDYALCAQTIRHRAEEVFIHIVMLRTLYKFDFRFRVHDPLKPDNRINFVFVDGLLVAFLPGRFMYCFDVSHKEKHPEYLFGSRFDNLPPGIDPEDWFAVLPSRTGNVIFIPDSPRFFQVELSKTFLWEWLRCAMLNTEVETKFIVGALHILNTHVDEEKTQLATAKYLERFIIGDFHVVQSVVVVELLLGETYRKTRQAACQNGKYEWWAALPMTDEHGALKGELRGIDKSRCELGDVEYHFDPDVLQRKAHVQSESKKWYVAHELGRAKTSSLFSGKKRAPIQRLALLTGVVPRAKGPLDPTSIADYKARLAQRLVENGVSQSEAKGLSDLYSHHFGERVQELMTAIATYSPNIETELWLLNSLFVALAHLHYPFPQSLNAALAEKSVERIPPTCLIQLVKSQAVPWMLSSSQLFVEAETRDPRWPLDATFENYLAANLSCCCSRDEDDPNMASDTFHKLRDRLIRSHDKHSLFQLDYLSNCDVKWRPLGFAPLDSFMDLLQQKKAVVAQQANQSGLMQRVHRLFSSSPKAKPDAAQTEQSEEAKVLQDVLEDLFAPFSMRRE